MDEPSIVVITVQRVALEYWQVLVPTNTPENELAALAKAEFEKGDAGFIRSDTLSTEYVGIE
jgi:hypothetical protein